MMKKQPSRSIQEGLSVRTQDVNRVLRRQLSLHDFERSARQVLPRPLFEYIAGAVEDQKTHKENLSVFDNWSFQTRVLSGVANRNQEVTLFGETYSTPFGVAPMGLAALSHYDGDMQLASAAAECSVPMVLSGLSLTPMERLIDKYPKTWFQAYLPGDIERIMALIKRVKAAGYSTLVLTVDIPVSANRENNMRTGFSVPLRPGLRLLSDFAIKPRWLIRTLLRTLVNGGIPHLENAFAYRGEPIVSSVMARDLGGRAGLNWEIVEQIRDFWDGNLVIKGVLSVEDSIKAKNTGADGIILSNHGGRQLDSAISPMVILSDVVRELGETPVMIDSGFRRGTDVLKAIALGAKMVFVGRPFNFALAVGGAQGVSHAIHLLRDEIDRNLAMLGAVDLSQMTSDLLVSNELKQR